MTECFYALNAANEFPAFEERLYQALYDGKLAWGRLHISAFEEGGAARAISSKRTIGKSVVSNG